MVDRTKVDSYKKEIISASDIEKVDFSNENCRLALLETCELNEAVRNGLSHLNPDHCSILHALTRRSYQLAEKFLPSQLTEKVVMEYLNHSLRDTDIVEELTDQESISAQKRYSISREGYPIIYFNYLNTYNNAIFYKDSDLHLVTYLLSDIDLYVKISNAISFFHYLDCPLHSINMEKVMEIRRRYLLENVREVLTNMVVKKQIGFFHFAGEFKNIEKEITDGINADLSSAGISIVDCSIKYITIPDNVVKEIQSQTFIISKAERERESLIAYQEKA